jgi:hypothetical protein
MADEGEATQPAQQDVKPDVKGEGEHLNLKVKAQVWPAVLASSSSSGTQSRSSRWLARRHMT